MEGVWPSSAGFARLHRYGRRRRTTVAQFTTALSCLFGATTRLSLVGGLRRVPRWLLATVTAAVSAVLSLLGFSDLIGWVYPALGYAGMVIIVLIVARWTVRRRDATAA